MFDAAIPQNDIFSNYFLYMAETEPPIHYHRWCWLGTIGAALGRKVYIPHGHFRIFPNLYIMLLGEPATRKSTSIKLAKKLFSTTTFENFSADKTTKEKFLLDLEGITLDEDAEPSTKSKPKYDTVTADALWGSSREDKDPREVFIVADEFNEFAGPGNLDFYTTLGNLWDFDDPQKSFTQRLKNSKSVSIFQPTISILSGNTPELFARAFPPEAIGSGFLSRLLLIHGERSGRRITFPPPPDKELGAGLSSYLQKLISIESHELEKSAAASELLHQIYQREDELVVTDVRFKAYNQRRFTQLQKLCVILAAGQFRKIVSEVDVLQANTILTHAELLMPKAMGEFGKNKNSDVANKIMILAERATKPLTMREIWGHVHNDLTAQKDLAELLNGLTNADKLQIVVQHGATSGWLPKKSPRKEPLFVDWNFLTQEERDMI